jgi:hypothetical protein
MCPDDFLPAIMDDGGEKKQKHLESVGMWGCGGKTQRKMAQWPFSIVRGRCTGTAKLRQGSGAAPSRAALGREDVRTLGRLGEIC